MLLNDGNVATNAADKIFILSIPFDVNLILHKLRYWKLGQFNFPNK